MTDEIHLDPNIFPVPFQAEVHSVHYGDTQDVGAFIVIRNIDLEHVVAADGSLNLFLSPSMLKALLKNLFEALVFPFDEEVANGGLFQEEDEASEAQWADDSEVL